MQENMFHCSIKLLMKHLHSNQFNRFKMIFKKCAGTKELVRLRHWRETHSVENNWMPLLYSMPESLNSIETKGKKNSPKIGTQFSKINNVKWVEHVLCSCPLKRICLIIVYTYSIIETGCKTQQQSFGFRHMCVLWFKSSRRKTQHFILLLFRT